MKKLQNIILSLFVLSTLFSSQVVTFAVTKENISKFTPQRPDIEYTAGMPGLPYSSFNNLVNNPNIPGAWQNDEKKFLVGGLCKGGTCPAGGATYYNTLGQPVQEGDVLRFALYFHNNGEDPYVTTSNPKSADATNVNIGVNLSNITDPADDAWIRPLGFISANGNQYRTDKNDPSTTLKDSEEKVIDTATDDMQVLLSDYDLYLEPVADSIFLTNKNAKYNDYLKGETSLQFVSDQYDSKDYPPAKNLVSVKVTPHYEKDRMYITFDKLPGCFRYSGFVYFDVKVVKKPATECTSLTAKVDKTRTDIKIEGETAIGVSATATFGDGKIPEGTKILWQSDDPNGRFWKGTEIPTAVQGKTKTIYDEITAGSGTDHPGALSDPDEKIYYTGHGKVTAVLDTKDPALANPAVCKAALEFPACGKLWVNYPVDIFEGQASMLTAKATDTNGNEFFGDITYWVDKAQNGKFYAKPPVEYNLNSSPYVSNFPDATEYQTSQDTSHGYQSTTIKQKETTYFAGLRAGEKLHIQVDGTNIPESCKLDLEIKPVSQCKELKVNKPSIIKEGEVAQFTAMSEDNHFKTFNGKITYSVSPEYGTFYTDPNDPAIKDKPKNQTTVFKEYDDSKPVVKPANVADYCINPTINFYPLLTDIIGNKVLIDPAMKIIFDLLKNQIPTASVQTLIQKDIELKLQSQQSTNILSTSQQAVSDSAFKTTVIKYSNLTGPQVGAKITVDPGTTVYFLPKKGSDGTKVLNVSTDCTLYHQCLKTYDITPAPKTPPVICEAAGLTVTDTKTNAPANCIKQGEYLLNAGFYADKNLTTLVAVAQNTSVQWTSTDSKGLFFDASPTAEANQKGANSPFVGGISVKYVGEGQVTATLVGLNGQPYTEKQCLAKIAPCTNRCDSITLTSNPTLPEAGKDISLFLTTKDLKGNPLPQDTKFNFTWDTNGTAKDGKTHQYKDGTAKAVPLQDLPLTFSGMDKDGKITATMDQSSPLYAERCKADISILKPEQPLTCKLTTPSLQKYLGTSQETSLVPNEIYKVSATTTYSKDFTNKNTFSVDPKVGAIVDLGDDMTIANVYLQYLKLLQDNHNLTEDSLTNKNDQQTNKVNFTLLPSKAVDNKSSEIVYFVTYTSDTTKSVTKALQVKAYGDYFNTDCDKVFPFNYVRPVPPTEVTCKNLTITNPVSPWAADKSKQLFEIDVETSPKNNESAFTYFWDVTKGDGEWSNGQGTQETSSLKNTLKNASTGTSVEVYAKDKNGKIGICSDTLNTKTVEIPEISKTVYLTSKNPPTSQKNLLNIGSNSAKNKNVTYKILFKANSAKEVDLSENALKNGIITGDKDGTMDYQGMIINVIKGTDTYTILRDGNYTVETEDSTSTDYKYSLASLQDKHNCKNGTQKAGTSSDKVCIDDTDFTNVVENFRDGNPITFKNLKTNTFIEIKVQMKITKTIDADACKEFTTNEGCGEEFNNKAKFTATMTNGTMTNGAMTTGNMEKGSASAKVIVICPYVLTRQSGDVIFHSALDTGIDVSRCSEVKNSPGPIIQIEKIQRIGTPKTGTGDLPPETTDLILTVPSHDICRYSNVQDKNSIAGYNDVLKNFSSTICEMSADVAETWKERYINASIKANVERISRFGENLSTGKLTNMTELQIVNNVKSGVFVKKGDLILQNDTGDFVVDAMGNVPAGQTYIIKGGTLHIKSNIVYPETTDYTNPKSIPSAAFIVIDGNIIIDNAVTRIDGIVMAVDTDGEGNDGKITNENTSVTTDNLLEVNGSMVGDVSELFSTRTGAGDPTKDQGAVTIRYDERILLNTPPGLSELLNVTQSLIPG